MLVLSDVARSADVATIREIRFMKIVVFPLLAMGLGYFGMPDSHAAEITFAGPVIVWNEPRSVAVMSKGQPLVAMNVGGNEDVQIHDINFQPGTIEGKSMVLTNDGVSISVTTDPQGGMKDPLNNVQFASNNPDYYRLFRSAASSYSENGWIKIEISGLTSGTKYRLQLFHFAAGVAPSTRKMILSDAADPQKTTEIFSYNDLKANRPYNPVRMIATWVADAPQQVFLLRAAPGFNRAVLNAVVLHSVEE